MYTDEILELCMKIAPNYLQEEWDNCGKQVFFSQVKVKNVLLATDFTLEVAKEAIQLKCEMVIVHHPLIFKPLKNLDFSNPLYQPLLLAIEGKISVIALHTSFDNCPTGMNEYILHLLGVKNTWPLMTQIGNFLKLVVYCPKDHTEKIRKAICEAGAGCIGNYSDCTFKTEGLGTFKGNDKTQPFLGKPHQLENALEDKLETILHETSKKKVIHALLKNHPYEEVAYDLIPLQNEIPSLGRIGLLEKEMKSETFANLIKTKLKLKHLEYLPRQGKIKTIGVITGGAGKFYKEAYYKKCDAFITGDIKHNEWLEAKYLNLMLINAGHYGTEKYFSESFLCNFLIENKHRKIHFHKAKKETYPYKTK